MNNVKNRIKNIIVVSDLHCGCQFGLCRDTVSLDGGGEYESSKFQKEVYGKWLEFWNVWVPKVTKNEPYAVVCNGDIVDGNHHGSVTQITHNLADQGKMAVNIMQPILNKKNCEDFFMIRGTEAHVGQSAENEEKIAKSLNAHQTKEGKYSRFELWLEFGKNKSLCHFTHHVGTTNSAAYESTAVYKELIEIFSECGRWGDKVPQLVCRSHRHRSFEIRIPTSHGYGISMVTPGWQLRCLGLDTLLPTVNGWTTMKDVSIGDKLFDEKGEQCNVVDVGKIITKNKCFNITFSNGETVMASDDHLWETKAETDQPNKGLKRGNKQLTKRIRTTQEIYDTLYVGKGKKTRSNHKLEIQKPLVMDNIDLPIPPYILGCWLGDGDSDGARITGLNKDVAIYNEIFNKDGYYLSKQKVSKDKCLRHGILHKTKGKLKTELRNLGLLFNKHIPEIYLRSSILQRLELLQGLMDTDGTTDGISMHRLSSSNRKLVDGFCELLSTLGIKYNILSTYPNDKDNKGRGKRRKINWNIQFFIYKDIMNVFKLPRKNNKVINTIDRKFGKSKYVHITSMKKCEPTKMRCIAVDSPSKLYRFGKTMLYTHNTPFTYKIGLGRSSTPQIGGCLIREGNEDGLYTRSKVWKIGRTSTEKI